MWKWMCVVWPCTGLSSSHYKELPSFFFFFSVIRLHMAKRDMPMCSMSSINWGNFILFIVQVERCQQNNLTSDGFFFI